MARYEVTVLAKKPPPDLPGPVVGQTDPQGWFDTGIDIEARTSLRITATGTITWTGSEGSRLGPEGIPPDPCPPCVDPSQPFCKLIGLIVNPTGSTQALAIGAAYQGVTAIRGRLYLVVNDIRGDFHDNTGHFNVTIRTSRRPRKLNAPNHKGRPSCPVYAGSSTPVNNTPLSLFDGEKFEDVTDLSVATPAGMLAFTRTYRQSQITQPALLVGAGWTHNHDLKIIINSSNPNQLIAALDGGTKALFLRQGMTSLYVADAGASAQIDAGGSGASTYTLTSIDKTEFVFDDQGRIRARRRANNEVWTYTYYAASHFAAGLLQEINDGYDRKLQFSYLNNSGQFNHKQLWRVGDHNAAGLESSSPTGRYVEFGYVESPLTDGLPLLSTVRDVRGHTWTYRWYGQQSGESNPNLANYLLSYTSPAVDTSGDDTADGSIIVKELTYTLSGSGTALTAIQQRQGKSGSDPFLLSTDYAFQAQGQPLTTETTAGRTTTHYFAGEVYEGSANPAGHKPTQGLLPSYRPEFQEDANGNVTGMDWSPDGRLLNSVTDALGKSTSFSYDDDRLSTVTDPEKRVTEYTYGDATVPRQPTVIKVKNGATGPVLRHQIFTYDAKGRTISEKLVDPASGTTVLQEVTRQFYPQDDTDNPEGYGFLKQITQKSLPTGNDTYTRYWYDSAGRVKKTQQSSNFGSCEVSFTLYDAAGNVLASICNFNGTEPTTVTQAVDLFQAATPEKNRVTTHAYDSLGRRWKTSNYYTINQRTVLQRTSLTLYDALGRVRRSIDNYVAQDTSAPGNWVFDGGQWRQERGGTPITFGDDNNHNLIADTAYNARGLVRRRQDALGNVTLYGYDPADRLVKTVQNASVEGYNNDYVGADADPDLSAYPGLAHTLSQLADRDIITAQGYDPAGNLVRSVDARGIASFTVYDALHRPVQVVQNAKAAATMDLNPGQDGYHAANDPRSADYVVALEPDRDLVTRTEYDAMGRVIRTRRLLENRDTLEQWDVTLYGYDTLGRQVRVIQHASNPNYDLADDPDLDGYGPGGNADQDILTRTTYDAAGRVATTVDVNGNVALNIYDGLGRQVRTIRNYSVQGTSAPGNWVFEGGVWKQGTGGPALVHGTNFDENIISDTVYDADGRVESTRNVDGRVSYNGYDALGRQKISIQNYVNPLISVTPPPPTYEFGDPVGWQWDQNQVRWQAAGNNPIARTSTYTPGTPYAVQTIDDLNVISQTEYDSQSRVLQTRDVRGNLTRAVYDTAGRQVKTIASYVEQKDADIVIDPSLWVWRTSGAGTGWHLSGSIDVLVAHGPDQDQNLISQTVYDRAGRVFSTRDAAGKESRFVYDAAGRRTLTVANYMRQNNSASQEVDPAGWRWHNSRWEFLYDPGDLISAPVWNAVDFGTGQDQNLISQTVYNKAGQVISTRDARGTQTTFTYDAAGRRLLVTAAAGSGLDTTACTGYDKAGRVRRTIQNYRVLLDDSGNLISPDVRNAGGWVFNPTDHGGNNDQNLISETLYDAASRAIESRNPAGNITTTAYDKAGQIERVTDPGGTLTVYRYDKLRRRVLVVQNYVPQGSPAVDPQVWVWRTSTAGTGWHQSASINTLIQFGTQQDQNIIVQVTHNRAGQVQNLREPRGNVTTYDYDALGRRWKLSNPAGRLWLNAFSDVNGTTRTTQTYPGLGTGGIYTFTHNTNRRGSLMTVVSNAPGATPDLRFTYDLAGHRTRMSEFCDFNFSLLCRDTFYEYDAANRLTRVALDKGAEGTIGETFTYQYDVGGRRTQLTLTYPNDRDIVYTYDPLGRLVTLTDYDNQTSTFDYDALNRHCLTSRPNGLLTRYRYDTAGRLRDLEHSQRADGSRLLRAYRYSVDTRGNRTQVQEVSQRSSAGTATTLGQDHPGIVYEGNWKVAGNFRVSSDVTAQLGLLFGGSSVTLVMGSGSDHSLYDVYINGVLWNTFDGYAANDGERSSVIDLANAGPHLLTIRNRRDKNGAATGYQLRFKSLTAQTMHDTQAIAYTYDALARLRTAVYTGGPTYTYGYDVAGNLTNHNGVTQTYNNLNQLTGAGATTYEYDPNGNVWKTNTVISHTWDRKNRLLNHGGIAYQYYGDGTRRWKNEGGVITWYFYDLQAGLPVLISAFNSGEYWRYMPGPRGTHSVEVNSTGAWSYLLEDGLGSIRQEVNAAGVVTAATNYEPYGVPTGASGTFTTDFRFAGEQVGNNGLSFNRARYYNPVTGTWTALDPWEGVMDRPLSLNGYAYVEGQVVNATDASGMCTEKAVCIALSIGNSIGNTWLCDCLDQCDEPPTCDELRRFSCDNVWRSRGCELFAAPTATPTASLPASSNTAILFLGGSRGGDIDSPGPRPECQTPVWHDIADLVFRYPGTQNPDPANSFTGKRQQAFYAGIPQAHTLVIGYSAGADAALIYAYDHRLSGYIRGVALLDGSLDGTRTDGRRLGCSLNDARSGCIDGADTDVWKDMFDALLSLGISIYFLDDESGGGRSKVANYTPASNNGKFKYDERLSVPHIDDVNTGRRGRGTNNSNQICQDVLTWFGEDASKCSDEKPKDCANPF